MVPMNVLDQIKSLKPKKIVKQVNLRILTFKNQIWNTKITITPHLQQIILDFANISTAEIKIHISTILTKLMIFEQMDVYYDI